MKQIPNLITCSRIGLSVALLFVRPLGAAFYIIYILCGLSDMVDGLLARKFGATSRLGEKLDSLADFVMIGILFILLLPVIKPTLPIIIWVLGIVAVRFAAAGIAFVKFKTFAFLHTYSNKMTGLLLFLFPLALPVFHAVVVMYALCTAASISAIEELIVQVTSYELDANRKSIFTKG